MRFRSTLKKRRLSDVRTIGERANFKALEIFCSVAVNVRKRINAIRCQVDNKTRSEWSMWLVSWIVLDFLISTAPTNLSGIGARIRLQTSTCARTHTHARTRTQTHMDRWYFVCHENRKRINICFYQIAFPNSIIRRHLLGIWSSPNLCSPLALSYSVVYRCSYLTGTTYGTHHHIWLEWGRRTTEETVLGWGDIGRRHLVQRLQSWSKGCELRRL